MIILVGTLLFIVWELEENAISADQLGREMFLFTIVLCIIFAIIALNLNVLVGNSILRPIGEMLSVIEKVKNGDLTQKYSTLHE